MKSVWKPPVSGEVLAATDASFEAIIVWARSIDLAMHQQRSTLSAGSLMGAMLGGLNGCEEASESTQAVAGTPKARVKRQRLVSSAMSRCA